MLPDERIRAYLNEPIDLALEPEQQVIGECAIPGIPMQMIWELWNGGGGGTWNQNINAGGFDLFNVGAIAIGTTPQAGFPLDISGETDPNIRVISTAVKTTASALGQFIIQSADTSGTLVSQIILHGDPLQANRRLSIGCSEAGVGYDNVTICEGNGGNVGIGLTSPLLRLAIAGDASPDSTLHLSYDGTDNGAYLGPGSANGLVMGAGIAYQSGWKAKAASGMMLNMFSNNLTFYNFTGATVGAAPALNAAVTINGSNVGIGQTSPAHALDVTGDINCTGQFMIGGTPHKLLTQTEYDGLIARLATLEKEIKKR